MEVYILIMYTVAVLWVFNVRFSITGRYRTKSKLPTKKSKFIIVIQIVLLMISSATTCQATSTFSPTASPTLIQQLPLQVATIVGGGTELSEGATGIDTSLGELCGVAVDNYNNIYIFSYYFEGEKAVHNVKKLTQSTGLVHTIAGKGVLVGVDGDGGPATSAELSASRQIYIDRENQLYIGDLAARIIRKIDLASGIISLFIGVYVRVSGPNGDGLPATSAKLFAPTSMWADSAGNFYLTDENHRQVRKRDASTTIMSLIAGAEDGTGGGHNPSRNTDNGPATSALLYNPSGIWGSGDGDGLYFCDPHNNAVRSVNFFTGNISTYAGQIWLPNNTGDGGPATSAQFSLPTSLWMDTVGNMMVADTDNVVVRRVSAADQIITRIAGLYNINDFYGDGGPATEAAFTRVVQVYGNNVGDIFVADSFNMRIRVLYNTSNTLAPNLMPTALPTRISEPPTVAPTVTPTAVPTVVRTMAPSPAPTLVPSGEPSEAPTERPSATPSQHPTEQPTVCPSVHSTANPSVVPSGAPSVFPTAHPTMLPTLVPSERPSSPPSEMPSTFPTVAPTSWFKLPPSFLSLSVVDRGRTSITVQGNMTRPGAMSCGAFLLSDISVDVSNVQTLIALQGFTVGSNAQNVSVLTIGGLSPATEYIVYCCTEGMNGARMTATDTLATEHRVATQCCKTVTIQLHSTNIVEGKHSHDFLSLTLSSHPSTEITVTQRTTLNGVQVAGGIFAPGRFTLKSDKSQPLLVSAGLNALAPPGLYVISVELSGPSAADYDVIHSAGDGSATVTTLFIYPMADPPPVPTLRSVTFSDDGTHLKVRFDSDTNRGDTSTKFYCNHLFAFGCAETSKCQWVSDSTVHAYITGGATSGQCVLPGGNFTVLQSGHIQAKCTQDAAGCSSITTSWQIVANSTVTVQAPVTPVTPSVVLVMPDSIGNCDALSIDASASYGSGGRAFKSATLSIRSTADNQAAVELQSFSSASNFTAMTPVVIPAELLAKGVVYTVAVTLCNFLGRCSQASKSVQVLDAFVPVVIMPGSTLRKMTSGEILTITAMATVQQCNRTQSNLGLTYQWSVSKNGATDAALITISKDPSKLLLPAYSLTTFGLYTVTLTVTSRESQQSSTATSQVYVTQGKVHARLAGGTVPRSVRMNESTVISASTSYDEDVAGLSGAEAGLQFAWACVQLEPVYNETCGNLFHVPLSASSEQYSLLPLTTASLASISQLTVTVTDSVGLRASQTSTVIYLRPALSPVAEISLLGSTSGVVNADQILRLSATVWFPQDTRGNATWSVDDGSLALSTSTLTPTSQLLKLSSSATQFTTLYFALRANTMTAGSRLTFSLTCVALDGSQLSTVARIRITVNASPLPGLFVVSPTAGVELQTQFRLATAHWVDDQLPLTYQFGYRVIGNGGIIVVRERNEFASAMSVLPAGLPSIQHQLTCVVQVFDSLNASTTERQMVTARNVATMDAAQIKQYVNNSLAQSSGSTSSVLQAVAMSNYLLNAVNCTLAPDCAALNRQECSNTPHTCGPCLSNDYIGSDGNSNDFCVLVSDWTESKGNACSDASDCGAYATCISGTCATSQKTCPVHCSGRGKCVFVNIDSGVRVPECMASDTTCTAICLCEAAYNMSSTCSVTNVDIQLKRQARAEVIRSIATMVNTQDVGQTTIGGWMSALAEVTRQSDELLLGSLQLVLELSNTIIDHSQALRQPLPNTSALLLFAVDSATQATMSYASDAAVYNMSHSHKFDATFDGLGANVSALVGESVAVLQRYASLVSSQMVPGETPIEHVLSQFRLGVHSLSTQLRLDGTADGSVYVDATLRVPQKKTEIMARHLPHSVALSFDRSSNTSKGSAEVALITMRSQLYRVQGLFQSNPLTLHMSDLPCPTAINCTVDVVLQTMNQLFNYDSPSVEHFVEVRCTEGVITNTTHTFTDVNYVADTSCNGSYTGVVTHYSPKVAAESVCNSILGDTVVDIGCRVKTVTDSNVTCTCPLSHIVQTAESNTTVKKELPPDTGYSVNFVSMLKYTTRTFAANFRSISSLDATTAGREYRVLITIGLLVGFTLCAMLFADRLDREAHKQHAVQSHLHDVSLWRSMHSTIQKYITSKQESLKVHRASQILPVSASFERGPASSRSSRNSSRNSSFSGKIDFLNLDSLRSPELTRVDNSLPNILRSTSLGARIASELKTHHKWLCVVYFYSTTYPRVLRVFALASSVTTMLFFQSLTYNLIHPDRGACSQHTTEADCVAPQSIYATGESMCAWVVTDSQQSTTNTFECVYIEPNQRIRIILFVAILSAALSVPVIVLIHWLIRTVLAAETTDSQDNNYQESSDNNNDDDNDDNDSGSSDHRPRRSKPQPSAYHNRGRQQPYRTVTDVREFSSDEEIAEWKRGVVLRSQSDGPKCFHQRPNQRDAEQIEANYLNDELRVYRLTIQSESEREEFDTLWGLDDGGFFRNREPNVEAAVKREIKEVKSLALCEKTELERNEEENSSKNAVIGKRLLFLLQCDLLPEIQSTILVSKARRDDHKHVRQVSWTTKAVTLVLITAVLAAMLLYIILFAINQSSSNQEAWLSSFLLWLFIEVVLSSTNSVLLTHVLLPSLVMSDVDKLKLRLVEAIRAYQEDLRTAQLDLNPKQDTSRNNILRNSDFLIYQSDWFTSGVDPYYSFSSPNTKTNDDDEDQQHQQQQEHLTTRLTQQPGKQLNAAKYLNVSHRLSSYYPYLLESQVVARFVTVYPRHSYQYCDGYSDGHSAAARTRSIRKSLQSCVQMITLTAMFVCINILNLSAPLQDVFSELISVFMVGYLVLLHIDLWTISPALVALPVFVIMVVVHFYTVTKKGDKKVKLLKMKATTTATTIAAATVTAPSEDSTIVSTAPNRAFSVPVSALPPPQPLAIIPKPVSVLLRRQSAEGTKPDEHSSSGAENYHDRDSGGQGQGHGGCCDRDVPFLPVNDATAHYNNDNIEEMADLALEDGDDDDDDSVNQVAMKNRRMHSSKQGSELQATVTAVTSSSVERRISNSIVDVHDHNSNGDDEDEDHDHRRDRVNTVPLSSHAVYMQKPPVVAAAVAETAVVEQTVCERESSRTVYRTNTQHDYCGEGLSHGDNNRNNHNGSHHRLNKMDGVDRPSPAIVPPLL